MHIQLGKVYPLGKRSLCVYQNRRSQIVRFRELQVYSLDMVAIDGWKVSGCMVSGFTSGELVRGVLEHYLKQIIAIKRSVRSYVLRKVNMCCSNALC